MDREELAQRILFLTGENTDAKKIIEFLTENRVVTTFLMDNIFKGKTEKEVKDGKSKD